MPQTSLQKLTEALTAYGWTFTTVETEVGVPDRDNPYPMRRYRSRPTYPTKRVPAVTVQARNGAEVDGGRAVEFEATFLAATGAYLPTETRGYYPFSSGASLKSVLAAVETKSVAFREKMEAQRAAEEAAELAKEREAVAASYAEAVTKAVAAKEAAVEWMAERLGLTPGQANEVLASAADHEIGKISAYVVAKGECERAGKGWATGQSYVRGTYRDGQPVA